MKAKVQVELPLGASISLMFMVIAVISMGYKSILRMPVCLAICYFFLILYNSMLCADEFFKPCQMYGPAVTDGYCRFMFATNAFCCSVESL